MTGVFLEQLCGVVSAPGPVVTAERRAMIGRAIADTLGVAAAGFGEPVTRNTLAAYRGNVAVTWSGEGCESREAAVLINGIAAHALDFDDVYLESLAHLSAVILPAILSAEENDPDEVHAAFGAGLVAAKAVARRVGRGHYDRGWHGTGTIGAFAAAAAAGRMLRLAPDQMADALALASAMSGGLQVNFSTQAKPAHAGFAAVAGLRAARLAAAGVTGSREVFSKRGFPGLYGTGDGQENVASDAFELTPERISVKLYPCCYATQRLVGIALDARASMGVGIATPEHRYRLEVPAGSMDALVSRHPRTGLEAKFSAGYCFAVAMVGGPPSLHDFSDEAVRRPDVTAAMERTEIVEDPAQPGGSDIESGEVRLTVIAPTGQREFRRIALPGSPLDPPDKDALSAKLRACFAAFERNNRQPFPMLGEAARLGVAHWIGIGVKKPARGPSPTANE